MTNEKIHQAKSGFKKQMGAEIIRLLKAQKITQGRMAFILGTNQPRISILMDKQFDSFRIETLLTYLLRLNAKIKITVQ